MSNNEHDDELVAEDLEAGGMEDSDSFDDFEGASGNNALSNPMVKVGIVVAAVATIIGGIVLFVGEKETQTMSRVRAAKEVTANTGMEQVSPEMERALTETNEEAAEDAARQGGSAMPVPINAPDEKLAVPDMTAGAEEDPLERWRKIQEERQKREALQAKPTGPQVDPNAQVIDKLAKSMATQMQTILDAQTHEPPEVEVVTSADWLEKEEEKRKQKLKEAEAEKKAAAVEKAEVIDLNIIQPAGTIEYAQLITEANSDVPGPVLAQIMSGPLAGSRILGTFEVVDDYLVLTFKTVVINGVSNQADIIALDPATANVGLATEIDRRFFSRVILPAAAAFVEGMGEAIAESGSTSVSVSGDTVVQTEEELDTRQEIFKGVEEGAGKISEIMDKESGKVKVMVKVEAGTAVGILFMKPVTEEKDPNKS